MNVCKLCLNGFQMFINESEEVPFAAILYMVGECNYGGRVTDDWDRRTLNTILADFCNIDVVQTPNFLFCDTSPKYAVPLLYEYGNFIKTIEVILNFYLIFYIENKYPVANVVIMKYSLLLWVVQIYIFFLAITIFVQ